MTQRYTKVAHNSKASYEVFRDSGKHDSYKGLILQELQKQPRTRRELVSLVRAGNPSNLTAPIKSLEQEGKVCKVGTKFDEVTRREVSLYGIPAESAQDDQGSQQRTLNSNRFFVTSEVTHQTDHSLTDKGLKNEF